VPNPIFTILDPTLGITTVRDPGLVFYAAIVGVPWQLIARQTLQGVPDLLNGVSAIDPTKVGGFKSYAELELQDGKGHSYWDDIAGDPEHYVYALSPYMVESTVPRMGVDPITGIAISPPNSPNGTNPINGHEWNIPTPAGDIEYACIFPILNPVNCADPSVTACDCRNSGANAKNPLCEPNPADNMNLTLQARAKAYPGVKHLAIAKGLGPQGIAASICAKQITDPSAPDFGYRPAIGAILDRLKGALSVERCLPKPIAADPQGHVACSMIEARHTGAAGCTCDAWRIAVPAADACYELAVKHDPLDLTAQWDCFCEIPQASGAALTSCENDVNTTTNGWCYVDAAGAGNKAIVAGCPASEERTLRFVGTGAPLAGSTVFLACK
jgi:hypothetical protein